MSFINESKLAGYRSRFDTFSKDNISGLKGSYQRDINKPMIFLSHKHDEFSILQDVIAFLKREGVDVYVDWMDDHMPAYTNAETAIRLKEKIKSADKFILVATPSAINSKWCNWELGLGDAAKFNKDIALLPINKNYENFKGAEYLKIYPYISYEDGNRKYKNGFYIPKGYYVVTPIDIETESVTSLKEWLQSK